MHNAILYGDDADDDIRSHFYEKEKEELMKRKVNQPPFDTNTNHVRSTIFQPKLEVDDEVGAPIEFEASGSALDDDEVGAPIELEASGSTLDDDEVDSPIVSSRHPFRIFLATLT